MPVGRQSVLEPGRKRMLRRQAIVGQERPDARRTGQPGAEVFMGPARSGQIGPAMEIKDHPVAIGTPAAGPKGTDQPLAISGAAPDGIGDEIRVLGRPAE